MNRRTFFKRTSAFIAGILGLGFVKSEPPQGLNVEKLRGIVEENPVGTDKEQEWAEFSVDTAIEPEPSSTEKALFEKPQNLALFDVSLRKLPEGLVLETGPAHTGVIKRMMVFKGNLFVATENGVYRVYRDKGKIRHEKLLS